MGVLFFESKKKIRTHVKKPPCVHKVAARKVRERKQNMYVCRERERESGGSKQTKK